MFAPAVAAASDERLSQVCRTSSGDFYSSAGGRREGGRRDNRGDSRPVDALFEG
jgi:hypothetical protein